MRPVGTAPEQLWITHERGMDSKMESACDFNQLGGDESEYNMARSRDRYDRIASPIPIREKQSASLGAIGM